MDIESWYSKGKTFVSGDSEALGFLKEKDMPMI